MSGRYADKTGAPRRVMTSEGFQSVLQNLSQHERSLRPHTPSIPEMNPAGVAPQQGRPHDRVAQMDAQIRRMQGERDFLQHANRAAEEEVTELKAKLRTIEAEKANLLRELDRMTRQDEEQRSAMKKLEEQTSKQKMTIKVQSDQIAQRASSTKATTTPHRGGTTPGAFSAVYSQPPPAYNPRHSNNTHSHPIGPPPPQTPMARQQSTPGPMSTTLSRGPSRGPSRGASGPQNPSHQPYSDHQLAQIQEAEPSLELTSDFARVFKLTEVWARNYTNVPDPEKDDNLPAHMRSSILQYTNGESGMRLMSSGSTRYLAIAKLMNYQITTLAFRPLIAKGYTPYHDTKIAEMRSQFYRIIPIHVRRALMMACADTFKEMTRENGFREHIDKLVNRQVHEMWSFLEFFFAPGVARNEAWNDLGEIWKDATRVGILMLLKPSSFTLEYPLTGPNSPFNPAQMVSRDVNFSQDPQTLAKMGVSIRLAVTPVVTETNFMSNEPVPKTLHYSNVLLQL